MKNYQEWFVYGTSDTQYRDKDGNPKNLPEGYKSAFSISKNDSRGRSCR